MLSGWELQYRPCDDEHGREVGVWVHDFSTGTPSTSTLRYKISSILRDKNDEPRHFESQGQRPGDRRGWSPAASGMTPAVSWRAATTVPRVKGEEPMTALARLRRGATCVVSCLLLACAPDARAAAPPPAPQPRSVFSRDAGARRRSWYNT
jgi:hypothetical protein